MGKSDILFLIILRIFLYIYRNGQCECEIYFVSHTQEIVTVDSPIHGAHDGCLRLETVMMMRFVPLVGIRVAGWGIGVFIVTCKQS